MSGTGDIETASDSFRRRLTVLVCSQVHVLGLAFAFEAVLLLLGILSWLFGDLNEATRTILILDFALLGPLTLLTGGLLALCVRR